MWSEVVLGDGSDQLSHNADSSQVLWSPRINICTSWCTSRPSVTLTRVVARMRRAKILLGSEELEAGNIDKSCKGFHRCLVWKGKCVWPQELMLSMVLPKTTQGCFLRKFKIFMTFKCIDYFLFFPALIEMGLRYISFLCDYVDRFF